jgi:putative ABC transport system permease protein
MISSYKKLTGKYLKAAKKRTVLTILGIVMSVGLISSIGLFFYSMQISQVEEAKNNFGAFHLMFTKSDESLFSKVTSNPKISRYGFISMGEEIEISNKLTIGEIAATDKALELLPYKAKEGRLPVDKNEIAAEKWTLSYIDKGAKVGGTIKFNNKEYILTGILENSMQNQVDNKGVLLSKNNNIDRNKAVLAVEISEKTNLKTAIDELKTLAPSDTVVENTMLLAMLGAGDFESMLPLYITLGIIIGIVVIATIAVIYNSFQISVVERIKQFGLLRAVGTTPKQIRKIVLREASILAAIGVPLGLLLGILAMYSITFTFKLIGGDTVFVVNTNISPMVIAISAVVGLVSIYLSALIPAFFAGRISPLVAISSRNSITKEKIKRRKSVLAQKLFGFEGALASKNIKRSRKRYRITVFSIVISVVLFITFKSFMDMTMDISTNPNESKKVHFSIVRDDQATEENIKIENKIVEDIETLDAVDRVYKVYDNFDFAAIINNSKKIKEVEEIPMVYLEPAEKADLESRVMTSLTAYDEKALEASRNYLISGSIDTEKLNNENGVIVIRKSRVFNSKTDKTYYGPVVDLKVGDEINLDFSNMVEEGKTSKVSANIVNKVKVAAILEDDPFNFRGAQNGLKLLTTKEVAAKLTGNSELRPINLNIVLKDVKTEEASKQSIENVIAQNPSLNLINNIDQNRKDKTSKLMVQILIYGFVIVVSLIGSVNIINTLTTNIILRKREFAALKSIGLTQKGLKKMITLEGLLYGIAGVVYGTIIGSLISFAIYVGLDNMREFPWTAPWNAIIIAGVSALIIGYLSVLAPLRRIKNDNLIEAIREE